MVEINDPFVVARFVSDSGYSGNDDCWNWSGMKNTNGYGRFSLNDKHQLAHRVSFQIFVGEIPSGMNVCHSCDNRLCVNPYHLWVGSQSENLKDAFHKGRHSVPDTSGGKNGNTKLEASDVAEIRRLCAQGARKNLVASVFGVSSSTVGNIVSRKTWKESK